MKKNFLKKTMIGLLAGTVMLGMPCVKTSAAQEAYTVTYRAGNVGRFAVSNTQKTDKKAMAEEVAELLYKANRDVTEIQVTENGAIKLTVKREAAVPTAPGAGFVQTDSGYFVKNVSEWGPGEEEQVVKNVDYIVDYGKLVDGVEYTVSHVDAVSGVSIAPVAIVYGNIGDTVEITAPAGITVSGAARYFLQGTASQTLVLSEDRTENVLEFRYQLETTGVREDVTVAYEEGDTVLVTQTVTVQEQSHGGAGAVLAPGQRQISGQKQIPEDQQAEEGEETTEAEAEMIEAEVIEEGTLTPDDNVPKEEDGQEKEITLTEEEQMALTTLNRSVGKTGIITGTTLAAVLLLAVGIVWLRYKRNGKEASEKNEEEE